MLPAVLTETVLTFSEAVGACPAVGGRAPSVKSVYFWANTGVLVGGARIKLEAARMGGRRVTSREAVERFFLALNGEPIAAPPRTPKARSRASERAMQFLRAEFAKT